MDPVNSLSNIMKTLRQRLYTQSNNHTNKKSRSNAQATDIKQKISIDELKGNIIKKSKAIDPDNKNPELTTQLILESILTWEFGEDLLNDPQFEAMRKDVQDTIRNDPSLSEKLNEFLKS